ncbi:MAG: hypothetical protein J1E65_02595 [Lachnospiraceae bacterium]|nr:hypothetical protein [Lachnospiraceae bacterium]
MKKKLLAVLLGTMMVLSLTACGNSKAGFSDDELVFKGSEDIEVELNHIIFVDEDEIGEYTEYYGMFVDDYKSYEETFATSRGLEIGMSLDDYKKLYNIKYGYAVWELITYDSYTYLDYYTNQETSDMYNDKTIDVKTLWLDLGWYKDGGSWKAMTDEEFMSVWFCEADLDDYDEVAILSVYLDDYEEVGAMYLYHFTYDDDWVMFQGWAE